ncbi:hypothetical protein KOW79_022664 [Hemibagrus wyckioides]|uniref:Transmembrane protein 154 n=1 Tax=Hemibagrus wyckioides TaxID=337641 RepID=A0A9D3N0Q4_9TELE|nr:transmembrane protein 154 [Hemibagrus wyckioides]KAG7314168.1 hypothetical protein KOW79_022664 [Hemibagrus wyckioides]
MTEGWGYGTMSVSALSKGHYCQRGLWEMAPDVLLFILALTACLIQPAHCEESEGSGVTKAEAQSTEISTTITLTPPVTSGTWSSTFTVDVQEEDVPGGAETLAQVTLEQNSTTNLSPNKTTTDKKLKSAPKSSVYHTTVVTPDIQGQNNTTQEDDQQEEADSWKMVMIAAVCLTLTLLLAVAAAGLLITCRRRKKNTADSEKDDPYLDEDFGEKVPMPMFEDDMPSVMELEMEDFEKWMIKGGSNISMDSKQRHHS